MCSNWIDEFNNTEDLPMEQSKMREFKRVAQELNTIGITPILYGSLGFSQALGTDFLVDDLGSLKSDVV